jgi:2-(1,2-epoxy-1,2-dihydrophenyl)acetyl-CoA isomerase
MSYGNILFELAGGIARLTLNRPDRLNSFNDAMHAEVRDAVGRVRADPSVRVLLLTGAGRGFCAGQDLGDRAVAPGADPVDLGASIDRNYKPLVLALRALPLPVVCAVNGVAAGAGANIALACDIVIAAKSASFVQAFSKIGLIPDSGGGARGVRRQAPGRAGGELGTDLALRRRRRVAGGRRRDIEAIGERADTRPGRDQAGDLCRAGQHARSAA